MPIWKYLHHLFSGAILLVEGIVLVYLERPSLYSWLFIIIGLFLVIDDIFAETVDKSLVGKINSDPIKLKVIGLIFFLGFEFLFILVLVIF